jgi:hypothetical protein
MPDLSPLRLPVITLVLALGACAGGQYPSLAQRPAERAYAQSQAIAPAPRAPGTPDAATLQRIARLQADAAKAHAQFLVLETDAAPFARAAHGSDVGSEAWAKATSAMASLDSARSDLARTLADLDALKVSTAVSAADADNPDRQATYVAVAGVDGQVAAILDAEDADIASLHKLVEN